MYGEEAVGGCHGAVVSHGNVRRLCRCETSVPARAGRRRRRLRSEVILARLGLRRECGAIPHSSSEAPVRSEEHTSELQSQSNLVCRLLLEKKKKVQSSSRACY